MGIMTTLAKNLPQKGLGGAGRSAHTRVVGGTSAPYHRPHPAPPSRQLGLSPHASSATTQRHRRRGVFTPAASLAWAKAGLGLHVISEGRPHGLRRAAEAASVRHATGRDKRRSRQVEPWGLTEPTHTPAGQVARWPNSPQDCRFTPPAWPPCFGTSLPSTISTPSSAPRSVSTSCQCWGHSGASCHRPSLLQDCRARTALGATPATASTIGSIDLRGNGASHPWREVWAAARGSRR